MYIKEKQSEILNYRLNLESNREKLGNIFRTPNSVFFLSLSFFIIYVSNICIFFDISLIMHGKNKMSVMRIFQKYLNFYNFHVHRLLT